MSQQPPRNGRNRWWTAVEFLGFCSIYFIWGELSRWTCTTWSWQVHGVDGGILLWYVGRSLRRSLVSAQRIISKTELCGTEITLKISRWAMICLVCTSVCCRCLCRIATCYSPGKELMIIYDWQIVCATLCLSEEDTRDLGRNCNVIYNRSKLLFRFNLSWAFKVWKLEKLRDYNCINLCFRLQHFLFINLIHSLASPSSVVGWNCRQSTLHHHNNYKWKRGSTGNQSRETGYLTQTHKGEQSRATVGGGVLLFIGKITFTCNA